MSYITIASFSFLIQKIKITILKKISLQKKFKVFRYAFRYCLTIILAEIPILHMSILRQVYLSPNLFIFISDHYLESLPQKIVVKVT